MATQKWIAGTTGSGLTWASAMTTELNNLANGSMAIASSAIVNGSNLDQYCDISFIGGSVTTTTGQPYAAVYLYPLNGDGSTYGDGQSGANAPGAAYWVGNISWRVANATAPIGTLRGVIMPPGSFKFVVYNQLGPAMAASNTLYYRTYDNSVA